MTKRHLLLFSLLMTLAVWRADAQVTPQGFNYQCIVRDATGASMNNQTVTLLFTVRNGTANGPVAYSEKQTLSTNEFGLINLIIGQGSPLQGTFGAINWGSGAKFLTVSVETAPNVFDELGSTQLMSVPYALYSQSSADGADNWGTQTVQTAPTLSGNGTSAAPLGIAQQGAQTGQVLKWDGTKWIPQDDISDTGQNGGTVTQINTGPGLTGGPITTTGTISLDNTSVAPGVYGGSAQIPVITVDQHGRVTDVFTVVPQPSTVGITGAAGINVQQNGINFTITNTGDINASDDLTTGTIADGDVSGPFSDLQIKANAVGSNEIANSAVGNTKLASNAVSTDKIVNNAVTTSKIDDAAVTADKLNNMGAASGQVIKWNGTTWVPAVDNTGAPVSLSAGTGINVTGAFPNFTINNTGDTNPADDITTVTQANGDVTGPFADLQLKSNVVGSPELAGNAVITPKISDGAVTGEKIAQMSATNGQVLKWNGTSWSPAVDNTGSINILGGIGIDVILNGNTYTIANNGDVNPFDDITDNSTAGGDVSGPFSNLQIKQNVITNFEMANNAIATGNLQNGAVNGTKIAQMNALSGQVLKWNGTAWTPANDEIAGGGGGDNWGTQVAITSAALSGNGTVANPLNLAQQGAVLGKVLKWNGSAWVPGDDNNDWGPQTVVSNATLQGNGTVASPLGIAQQSASNGQVLKWNGTTWAPANDDAGGDDWGAQVAVTNPTIAGDGTAGNPLRMAQQSASNGQVLKWNGTLWAPADDNNTGADNWGSQVAVTGATLSGNGTAGTPLNIAQQGAANGQALKWNGSSWAPANDTWGTQVALTGTTLTGNGVTPLNIAQQGATTGQVLKWNGTTWAPADDSGTGVGDNWGTQVVEASTEFIGNGTGGNPLELAPQGASFGQVLKWKGTFWGPADDDNTGDNWGVQSIESSVEFSGNGTSATPLHIAQQSATNGQVLKWNGTGWAPADDLIGGSGGNNYSAGTGISITGTPPNLVINNTGDLSNTNELQTLSLAGNNLSLSNGGGTVTLPPSNAYSAGAGINITGSAPNFTIINTGDADNNPSNELQTMSLAGNNLSLSNGGGTVTLPNYSAGTGINISGSSPNFTINNTGDADNNPANELQTISLAGNDLTLSNGGGTVTLPSGNTYTAGTGISITGSAPNFTINNTGDTDNDPANELQTLSLNGTTLKISGLNSEVSLDTVLNFASTGYWSLNGNNIYNSNTGNVGIGTDMPATKLHIKADGEAIRLQGSSTQIGFADGAGSVKGSLEKASDAMTLSTADSSAIILATSASKAVVVNGVNGNVGIGDANNSAAKLAVYHGLGGGFLLQNQTGNNWEFRVSSTISGSLLLFNNTLGGGFPAGTFATNGIYTPSDRRLKKDITHLPGVLDKLMHLDAVSYRYKPEKPDSPVSIGFLAQDVQAYFPELVTQNESRDGQTYLGLNYSGFGVLAVKAIQEQQGQIETLRTENDTLRKRLDALESRMPRTEQTASREKK